jgi:hypothetical protein
MMPFHTVGYEWVISVERIVGMRGCERRRPIAARFPPTGRQIAVRARCRHSAACWPQCGR